MAGKPKAKRISNSKAPLKKEVEGVRLEAWPVTKPTPYGSNPRKIADKAIHKVAQSLTEFGWQQPIVVDAKGVVLAGHTRLEAAKYLGMKTVPVVVANLSGAKARAYRIADNRTAQESTWDNMLLISELTELEQMDYDLAFTGFGQEEIASLFSKDFAPDLNPSAAFADITAKDIDKADGGLNQKPIGAAEQNLVEVTCPHCGRDFDLDPKALS